MLRHLDGGGIHYSLLSEMYDSLTGNADIPNWFNPIADTNGRWGGRRITLAANVSSTATKFVPANDTYIAGIALSGTAATDGGTVNLLGFKEGATYHVTIGFNNNQKIIAFRGNGTIQLGASANNVWPSGAFFYLEAKVKVHDSAGTVDVYVNGVNVLSLSGIDTNNGGAIGTIDGITFGSLNAVSNGSWSINDIYFADNTGGANDVKDVIGNCRITQHIPSGAGNYAQWTPSTSTNVSCIDEAQTNSTDHNDSSTVGQQDSFVIPDLPGTIVTVYGVALHVKCLIDDAGPRTIRGMLRISGTDYFATGQTPPTGTTYKNREFIFNTSPATNVKFTPSEVNGMEAGYEVET